MDDKPKRGNYLNVDQQFILQHACRVLWEAGLSCYQVGSSLTRPDYRDVDIRAILHNHECPKEDVWRNLIKNPAAQKLVEMSISSLLQRMTRLPIDFQIQTMEQANDDPKNEGPRNAIGMHVDNLSAEQAELRYKAKFYDDLLQALQLNEDSDLQVFVDRAMEIRTSFP